MRTRLLFRLLLLLIQLFIKGVFIFGPNQTNIYSTTRILPINFGTKL